MKILGTASQGTIRSVITHLHMIQPPSDIGEAHDPQLSETGHFVERADGMGVADYRALYRAVGERWLWWERTCFSDTELAEAIAPPGVEIRLLKRGGGADAVLGYAELDRRRPGNVEIAYFGLVPEAIGRGLGRYLMTVTLAAAWAGHGDTPRPRRVWLHTCSEDHPGALDFYHRAGFRICGREMRIIPDPRRARADDCVGGTTGPAEQSTKCWVNAPQLC